MALLLTLDYFICLYLSLHITGTESEMKDYERKFEGGQWLPFGETATLEDSTNKADPVSTTAGTHQFV